MEGAITITHDREGFVLRVITFWMMDARTVFSPLQFFLLFLSWSLVPSCAATLQSLSRYLLFVSSFQHNPCWYGVLGGYQRPPSVRDGLESDHHVGHLLRTSGISRPTIFLKLPNSRLPTGYLSSLCLLCSVRATATAQDAYS